MTLFVYGLMLGLIGMAFVVLIMSIHSRFSEIKWHDARLEEPSDYKTSEGIEVLVRLSSGRVVTTAYFPEVQSYAMYRGYTIDADITHWAYVVEVSNTIPKYLQTSYSDRHAI